MERSPILFFCLFAGLLFMGCTKENENAINITEFAGYYTIVSIRSSVPVDMNNNGIQSTDILDQISHYHVIKGERYSSLFHPIHFRAEVRPHPSNINDTPFISFNYPYQIILNEEEEEAFLFDYMPVFMTYTYELKPDNTVEITDFNPGYTSQYGAVHSVIRVDEKNFKVNLSLRLYDFKEKGWVKTDLIVEYAKEEQFD